MYVCFRAVGRYGAILADEMGLGKTLQSVALSWTLLKQGPYGGKPVAKRVLVVTPGSLVQNWGAEFNKWLGRERINVFTVDQVKFCLLDLQSGIKSRETAIRSKVFQVDFALSLILTLQRTLNSKLSVK